MKERLPPLQGLYYFYQAAKQGSFKSAANLLFVSAAAVSQQIRQLEEHLGCELFYRQHRRVELTPEGRALYKELSQGFEHISRGVQSINNDANPNRLSISTLPSFAQHWLVPRIQSFRDQHPEIALLLEPNNKLVRFKDEAVDICIRYGEGQYEDVKSELLMEDIIYPVCHPLYQQQHGIYSVHDLHKADLIEDTWPDMDWSIWLKHVGAPIGNRTLQYNGSHFVVEGALSVQGVGLIKHSLAYRYIKEGTLVRIGNYALKPQFAYYLCAPSHYFSRPKIQTFSTWLKSEVQEFQSCDMSHLNIIETDYVLHPVQT
ncbi:LysR substrate-binding domain-containing protein [Vibrio hangzhouensis]|uniref:LysR family transcriptional regulator, glycine cleavage system transcriptional activator n=1 Tax=Vibrio hangzhouensis TaxID=462991 RepID=A0A1H5UI54_9VIBR|nr:LysR substrate-binding domain-containing protein [Vibrio hangzhouensis]SEF74733.1 LysR family transcriptional regulator, glycine cleavage system transcriptional activator [Vibrio hangzhouensis]